MIKKTIPTIGKILYIIVIALVTCFACLLMMSAFDIPGGIKLYTVQSGSMSPTIPTGSVIFSRTEPTYAVGDIITFKPESERQMKKPINTTTHRITRIETNDQKTTYKTKGDANNAEDGFLVANDLVMGRCFLSLPFLGFPLSFAKTQTGLIVLIVIPATIIVYNELMNIKKEIAKLLKKKNHHPDEKDTD